MFDTSLYTCKQSYIDMDMEYSLYIDLSVDDLLPFQLYQHSVVHSMDESQSAVSRYNTSDKIVSKLCRHR